MNVYESILNNTYLVCHKIWKQKKKMSWKKYKKNEFPIFLHLHFVQISIKQSHNYFYPLASAASGAMLLPTAMLLLAFLLSWLCPIPTTPSTPRFSDIRWFFFLVCFSSSSFWSNSDENLRLWGLVTSAENASLFFLGDFGSSWCCSSRNLFSSSLCSLRSSLICSWKRVNLHEKEGRGRYL